MLACEYVAFHSCLITKFKTSPFFFTMSSPPSLAHGFADTALPASSQVRWYESPRIVRRLFEE